MPVSQTHTDLMPSGYPKLPTQTKHRTVLLTLIGHLTLSLVKQIFAASRACDEETKDEGTGL